MYKRQLLEQRTELVRGGTPVGVVAQGIGQSLGLLHNRGTFGQRLGDGGLVSLAQLGLLGRSGLLQCFELGLERLNICLLYTSIRRLKPNPTNNRHRI